MRRRIALVLFCLAASCVQNKSVTQQTKIPITVFCLDDITEFVTHMDGPVKIHRMDHDRDGDLDLCDFAVLQRNYKRLKAPSTGIPFNGRGVWIEVNRGTPSELQNLATGIPFWEPIVDYIVVSTAINHSQMYSKIFSKKQIVPGLKPTALFNCPRNAEGRNVCDLNNLPAWIEYGEQIRKIVEVTGTKVIVLENEVLVLGHTVGETQFDPLIVSAGLRHFPQDIMYYWYPSVSSYRAERRANQEALCRVVAKNLRHVRFVNGSHGRHSTIFRDFNALSQSATESLNDNAVVDIVYVYPSQEFWGDDQVNQLLLELFSEDEVMLYPGAVGFTKQGQKLGKLLFKRP